MTGSTPIADGRMTRQPYRMFVRLFRAATMGFLLGGASAAVAVNLPTSILRQLPTGYTVLTSTTATVGTRRFEFVALRSRKELPSERYLTAADEAPDRPLLIFEQHRNGSYAPVGRNDTVIGTADSAGMAGNGCDPFEDHGIATKGRYFTIENGVSCGAHWTDYITFRFEPQMDGYVFDNERVETWKLNPSNDPNAEALIPDVHRVLRPPKGKLVRFADWRPPKS